MPAARMMLHGFQPFLLNDFLSHKVMGLGGVVDLKSDELPTATTTASPAQMGGADGDKQAIFPLRSSNAFSSQLEVLCCPKEDKTLVLT